MGNDVNEMGKVFPKDSEGRSNNSADLCSHQQGQECVSMHNRDTYTSPLLFQLLLSVFQSDSFLILLYSRKAKAKSFIRIPYLNIYFCRLKGFSPLKIQFTLSINSTMAEIFVFLETWRHQKDILKLSIIQFSKKSTKDSLLQITWFKL